MAHLFFLIRRWNDLKRVEVANVEDNNLVCVVHGEDKGTVLDDVDCNNRISMTFQASKMRIAKQVLRTPNIGEDLKSSRDKHASEVLHVAHMSHSCSVFLRESPQCLSILKVIEHYCPIKRACGHTKWICYLYAVR